MFENQTPEASDQLGLYNARIEQRLYFVEGRDKRRLLVHLLGCTAAARTLVFSRTKHGADGIVDFLEQHEVSAAALHGNKSPGAHRRALDGFRGGSTAVLVATDVAARGVDVEGVSHVVNFDLPSVPETFVHRIGRSARAEALGIALSFCDTDEIGCLAGIERLLGERIDRAPSHPFALSPTPSHADVLTAGGRKIPSARTHARAGADQRPARTGSSARR